MENFISILSGLGFIARVAALASMEVTAFSLSEYNDNWRLLSSLPFRWIEFDCVGGVMNVVVKNR